MKTFHFIVQRAKRYAELNQITSKYNYVNTQLSIVCKYYKYQ